jgi:hypothetical protein
MSSTPAPHYATIDSLSSPKMGAKQKVKAAMQTYVFPEPSQDDGLLDDLVAQLDSNNPIVQKESSTVLQAVQQQQQEVQSTKKNSRTRFKEREVSYIFLQLMKPYDVAL